MGKSKNDSFKSPRKSGMEKAVRKTQTGKGNKQPQPSKGGGNKK